MQTGSRADTARFAVLLALLAACFLMGGASRLDVLSLIILQPLAALCAAAFLLIPGRPVEWSAIRIPLLLLAVLAGITAAQLIPLPPGWWTNLPGHAPFARTVEVAGLQQPWRPISLTPDLTLASLVGLIVPLAVLIGFAAVPQERREALLPALLAGIALSALFGIAQIAGGLRSPFYLYEITNRGSAVGLFSNRNHQAVLVAMAWPMLAVWGTMRDADPKRRMVRRWIAVGFALFLLPLLLVTGSRAGLVLGLLGLGTAALIWRGRRSGARTAARRGERIGLLLAGLGAVAVLVATIVLSRAEALRRLFDLSAAEDTRVEVAPILLEMARDFFPVGSGFGSFDPAYRMYEPVSMLSPQYLNHAHNDLIEIAITAGLPGILLVLLFLAWFAVRALAVWRAKGSAADLSLARLSSAMIGFVLLSSLVDYPLRTPLMMAIFAIGCGWLAAPAGGSRAESV